MNTIDIGCQGLDEPAWLDRYSAFADTVLCLRGQSRWEVSVVLCDDDTIQGLNREYRGKDIPTDVLSFCQLEGDDVPDGDVIYAGDIVVSLPSVEFNAAEAGVSLEEELKRVMVHGILHLEGLDHATNDPGEAMLVLQEEILVQLQKERLF